MSSARSRSRSRVLGVTRIAVVQHTDCKMESAPAGELRRAVEESVGTPLPDFDPLAIDDHTTTLAHDVSAVLDSGLIAAGTVVAGLVYDLHSGRLSTVVAPRHR